MLKSALIAPALLFACLVQTLPLSAESAPAFACRWQAQLTAAREGVEGSYQVPFELLVEKASAGLNAALVNGSDRIAFSGAVSNGRELSLKLAQYDAALTLRCANDSCDRLEGEYVRQRAKAVAHYAVTASCPPAAKLEPVVVAPHNLSGDWKFDFTDAAGKAQPSEPARFTQQGRHVEGTVAPVSGDYGLLSGEVANGAAEVHLSRFDGIHLLRLDGRIVSPERIEGIFHEGVGTAFSFVATRAQSATGFEEAEQMTTVANAAEPFRFHGTDAAGASVTEADPRFRGKVVVVDIFGSWCPNCHDEAPLLAALYARYHSQGLEIVGLSYEYTNDRARNQRLIEIYQHKYSIPFLLLQTGTTDSGDVEKTLPQLRNFGAFPTTIFLDRQGRAKLIHAGFSGPATGRMDELKAHFEREVEKLLAEP